MYCLAVCILCLVNSAIIGFLPEWGNAVAMLSTYSVYILTILN